MTDTQKKATASIRDEEPRQVTDNGGYLNKLTPPAGTMYWRHQTFTPMVERKLIEHAVISDRWYETLTWRIDAYAYVVDAKPDSDFSKNGGSVYLVIVNGGSASTGATVGPNIVYRYTISLRDSTGSAPAIKQLPPSNSGVTDGDNENYPISFAQDLQMFRNSGNDAFTFTAQYEDSVNVKKGQQFGAVNGAASVQWGIQFNDYTDYTSPFPFTSVSVFQMPSMKEATFDVVAEILESDRVLVTESETVTVDCRFSA